MVGMIIAYLELLIIQNFNFLDASGSENVVICLVFFHADLQLVLLGQTLALVPGLCATGPACQVLMLRCTLLSLSSGLLRRGLCAAEQV